MGRRFDPDRAHVDYIVSKNKSLDKSLEWIDVGETKTHRDFIKEFVKTARSKSHYKVLDVGGGADSWAKDFADATLDIMFEDPNDPFQISGDLFDSNTWKQFADERFDLVILSHILEDIRDPFYLIEQAFKISKKIFVSVPHKTLEFRKIESFAFAGFHHHRYIFSSDGENLYVTPKTSLTNAWLSSPSFIEKFAIYSKIVRNKFEIFDTVVGWDRALVNLPAIPKVSCTTSLSLLINSRSQVKNLDFIESGSKLLETYKKILHDHQF